jgi:hypothetical protein
MGDIRQETSNAARDVGEAVGHKAEEVADRSRQAGAEGVARAARTAEAVADAVSGDAPAVAEYVRGAAQKIERLAGDLREKKVGELLSSAAEFGRSQPVAMLAGAALVGFALSRVIKAGVATPAAAKDTTTPEYEPMRDLS